LTSSGRVWMTNESRAERKKTLEKGDAVAVKKRNDIIAEKAGARQSKRLGIKDKWKEKDGNKGKSKGKKGKGRAGLEGGRKEKTKKA